MAEVAAARIIDVSNSLDFPYHKIGKGGRRFTFQIRHMILTIDAPTREAAIDCIAETFFPDIEEDTAH